MVDTFAHAAWSALIYRKLKPKKLIWLAALFGILPDLSSWFIYMVYRFFTTNFRVGRPDLTSIPSWVFTLYGISHSLFVFGLVILIIYLIFRKIPSYLYAWLIHILIDIPTHSRDFLPTPFLWPISDWYFPGISWGTPPIMIINWSGIIIFAIYVFFIEPRKNKKTK